MAKDKPEQPEGIEYEYANERMLKQAKREERKRRKEELKAERERRKNCKLQRWQIDEAQKLFVDEAFTAIKKAQDDNMPMDSEAYERICRNAEHLSKAAESCGKISESEYKYSLSMWELIVALGMDAAVFIAAFILKHPIPPAALKFRKK